MWRGEVYRATNLGVKESAGKKSCVVRGGLQGEELCGEGMLTGVKSCVARGGLQGN